GGAGPCGVGVLRPRGVSYNSRSSRSRLMSMPVPAFVFGCANYLDIITGLFDCTRCLQALCSNCLVELQGKLVCAVCKEEVLRDLRSGTAELDYAGPGK